MKDLKEPLFKYETVLVLLDGSELAEQALIPALIIAESMTAKVQLLQVVTGLTLNLDPTLNQRLVNKRERIANQYLESLQLRYSKAGAIIDTKTAVGPAAKTIIDFAKDYDVDLIVMSSHGHTGLKRWVYGDVATKILRRAPCDTLITRPLSGTEPFSKNRILVPLDGSHLAERALGPAVALALERDMDILLLRVSPPVFIELEPLGSQYTFDGIEGMAVDINPKYSRYSFSSIEVEAKEEAKVYLQNLRAALPPLPGSVKIEVLIGTPAAAIVDYADEQEVDLIIMSSHGRTGTFLWLMGSVAEKVLRKAACPTLIVRPPKQ